MSALGIALGTERFGPYRRLTNVCAAGTPVTVVGELALAPIPQWRVPGVPTLVSTFAGSFGGDSVRHMTYFPKKVHTSPLMSWNSIVDPKPYTLNPEP